MIEEWIPLGRVWSQSFASSLKEKGNNLILMESSIMPFIFKVSQMFKKLEIWVLGSSILLPANLFFHCTFNKCWIDFKTAGSNKRIEYLISNNLYCCNIVAKSVPKWQLRWCFFGHWFFNYLHNKFLKMLRSSFTLILAIICTSRVLPWFSCG